MNTLVLDQTRDLSGTETHRITSLYPPPDFVKSASTEQLCGPADPLPSHLFADPAHRNYPCHTAAATWLSTAFFVDKRASFDDAAAERISARLAEVAKHFGIGRYVGELVEKAAAAVDNSEASLPDSSFAWVWADAAGNKQRRYPLRNPAEVKTASQYFKTFREQFAFDDRRQIAAKILEKAASLGAAVEDSESLARAAGYGYCAANDIVATIQKRAKLVRRFDAQAAQEMDELAKQVAEAPPQARDHGIRCKLASVLDAFDRAAHLTTLYNDGLERPEDVLFQVTEKAAEEFVNQHVCLTNGSIYEKSALASIPLDTLEEWMGTDLVSEVKTAELFVDAERLATIAATLPAPDADIFDKMAASVDIRPFARDKAASDRGMSTDEMVALAGQYTPTEQHPL